MTPDDVAAQRQTVVNEGIRFIGTPYHHAGRVLGSGVDCVTFLALSFMNARVVEPITIPYYPPDWHMHRDAERYMDGLLGRCTEVAGPPDRDPLPGDILLFRMGRTFSHGALVENWPTVIHSFVRVGVTRTDALRDNRLTTIGEAGEGRGNPRPTKFFCLTAWLDAPA